jgi:hypothetical protein
MLKQPLPPKRKLNGPFSILEWGGKRERGRRRRRRRSFQLEINSSWHIHSS